MTSTASKPGGALNCLVPPCPQPGDPAPLAALAALGALAAAVWWLIR